MLRILLLSLIISSYSYGYNSIENVSSVIKDTTGYIILINNENHYSDNLKYYYKIDYLDHDLRKLIFYNKNNDSLISINNTHDLCRIYWNENYVLVTSPALPFRDSVKSGIYIIDLAKKKYKFLFLENKVIEFLGNNNDKVFFKVKNERIDYVYKFYHVDPSFSDVIAVSKDTLEYITNLMLSFDNKIIRSDSANAKMFLTKVLKYFNEDYLILQKYRWVNDSIDTRIKYLWYIYYKKVISDSSSNFFSDSRKIFFFGKEIYIAGIIVKSENPLFRPSNLMKINQGKLTEILNVINYPDVLDVDRSQIYDLKKVNNILLIGINNSKVNLTIVSVDAQSLYITWMKTNYIPPNIYLKRNSNVKLIKSCCHVGCFHPAFLYLDSKLVLNKKLNHNKYGHRTTANQFIIHNS